MITTDRTVSFNQSAYFVYETDVLPGIGLVLNHPPPVDQSREIDVCVKSDNASGELLLNYSIINCH